MKHRISWIAVYSDGSKIARKSWMSDSAFGWEAQCSCGWKTSFGGAIASCVRSAIKDHKDYGWIDLLSSDQLTAYAKGLVTLDQLEAVTA